MGDTIGERGTYVLARKVIAIPPMTEDFSITEKDVRAMVRLLGEVAANPGDYAVKKRHLMDGLCLLIGADLWVSGLCTSMEPGNRPVYIVGCTSGFEPKQFGIETSTVDQPELTATSALEHTENSTRLVQLQPHKDPGPKDHEGPYGLPRLGAWDQSILSSYRPFDGGMLGGISLYRRPGRPLFGPREAHIADAVLSGVPWLYLNDWPKKEATGTPTLSPRLQTVLNLLIMGLSRKEIAASLKISRHTVKDYVKAVLCYFGVNRQTQLVSRFQRGDAAIHHDQPWPLRRKCHYRVMPRCQTAGSLTGRT